MTRSIANGCLQSNCAPPRPVNQNKRQSLMSSENGRYDAIYALLLEQGEKMGGVLNETKALRRIVEKSEETSAESRGQMREGLQYLTSEVHDIKRRVERNEARLNVADDYIARHERMEQRWGGAAAILMWLGRRTWAAIAFVVGLAVAYWHDIWAWLAR